MIQYDAVLNVTCLIKNKNELHECLYFTWKAHNLFNELKFKVTSHISKILYVL